jgi:hypothetical protein
MRVHPRISRRAHIKREQNAMKRRAASSGLRFVHHPVA